MSTTSKPAAPQRPSDEEDGEGSIERPDWLLPVLGMLIAAHLFCLYYVLSQGGPRTVWLVLLHAVVPLVVIGVGIFSFLAYENQEADGLTGIWAVVVGLTGLPVLFYAAEAGPWIGLMAGGWFALAIALKPPLQFTAQRIAILVTAVGMLVGLVMVAHWAHEDVLVERQLVKDRAAYIAKLKSLHDRSAAAKYLQRSHPQVFQEKMVEIARDWGALGDPPRGTEIPPELKKKPDPAAEPPRTRRRSGMGR